jgi:hypothetical protein
VQVITETVFLFNHSSLKIMLFIKFGFRNKNLGFILIIVPVTTAITQIQYKIHLFTARAAISITDTHNDVYLTDGFSLSIG